MQRCCSTGGNTRRHVMHMPSAGSGFGSTMFQPFPPLPKSPFSSPCGSPRKAHFCHANSLTHRESGPCNGKSLSHQGSGPCNGKCRADVQGTQRPGASPRVLKRW